MNAQHTRGPWEFLEADDPASADNAGRPLTIGEAGGDHDDLANVFSRDDSTVNTTREEAAANARLIAAAPDLLDALSDMLAGWHYIRRHYGDVPGVGWDRCDKAATEAIIRATNSSLEEFVAWGEHHGVGQ